MVRATAIAPEPIAGFRAVDVRGVVHSSADPWRRPTRARRQKIAEDEYSVDSPV